MKRKSLVLISKDLENQLVKFSEVMKGREKTRKEYGMKISLKNTKGTLIKENTKEKRKKD